MHIMMYVIITVLEYYDEWITQERFSYVGLLMSSKGIYHSL